MAGRFVRESKLRNVFGQMFKKDQFFESIRVSKNSNTQMFCAVNPKFMAVVTHAAGGGSFLVLPHNKTGRLDINQAQIVGHKAPVIDIAWSPFEDDMIASCDENGVIMIWKIPEEGVTSPMEEPLVMQDLHQKRCSLIKWHPLAKNVILSCGVDLKIVVWNMDEGTAEVEIDCPDIVQDMCWSPDGKTFATGSKDKKIRVYEGRSGKLLQELPGHASPREMRIMILKDDRLLSTGFTKESRREYRIWDLKDTSDSLYEDSLDQTSAPLNILYDPDINIVYLVGKGDCVIRYYEVNDEEPHFHYLSTYQSSSPQRGMGFMPKRGLNVNACEIARMYKVTLSSGGAIGAVEPLSMIIPRKSELYQADIYPDTLANEPAVSASEWFSGTDGKAKYMSMQQFFVEKDTSSGKGGLKKGGLKKTTTAAAAPAASAPAASAPATVSSAKAPVSKFTPSNHSNSQSKEVQDLVAEITKLKATVAEQEKRIAALEAK
ncbi:coronin-1B [Strongylocentrotus purpuratus]|uniref:Coronin n=1 Tax=Strongylocentrotus purpuratus TaxID=7668 RepID=A0A7M7RGG0_STRPU|nr:coronin-1B [Strongylocentrotus purpuratus]